MLDRDSFAAQYGGLSINQFYEPGLGVLSPLRAQVLMDVRAIILETRRLEDLLVLLALIDRTLRGSDAFQLYFRSKISLEHIHTFKVEFYWRAWPGLFGK